MAIKFHNSLSLRTGLLILLAATAQTLLLNLYFYDRTFEEQITQSNRQIEQLVSTVENTAAAAAYLDNQELAEEVTRGLASNDIVSVASLTSNSNMVVRSGQTSSSHNTIRSFDLTSPFMPGEVVGQISIHPNHTGIEARASEVAQVYVFTLGAHSFCLTLLVILLLHWLLSKPIKNVAERLHEIEPGSDARVSVLSGHKHDEVGQLVSDINSLLESTELTLDAERRMRQYVESLEKRFRLIFEKASCGIALVDKEGLIVLRNPVVDDIVSTVQPRLKPETIKLFELFEDHHQIELLLQQAQEETTVSQDLKLLRVEGSSRRWLHAIFSPVRDENNELLIECVLYDISERARREQQVRHEAERDPLTQLYNRRAGTRFLEEALQKCQKENQPCCVMLIDLDKFKPINDTHGHEAGDKILISVAERMTQALRKSDVIIRWGGDEFLVMAMPSSQNLEVECIATKLIEQIRLPVEITKDLSAQVGASIGIAIFEEDGYNVDELIRKADLAMYSAKKNGRNQFQTYNDSCDDSLKSAAR